MIPYIIHIIEFSLLCYITFNVFYVFLYSVAGVFYKETIFGDLAIKKENKFVIVIPAYKNDEVVLNTVRQNLNQSYSKNKFEVVVIADSFEEETLRELDKLPVRVIKVDFEESTKAKALNWALNVLPANQFDYCLVLDVDNVMEVDFLVKINARLQNNEMIVQARRTAKNLDTPFAVLDGLSEEINNHIFRKGHVALGVTSALSGSGQAMQYGKFKELMGEIESPVEDKELEFALVRNKIKVHFENQALVYDEKVQNAKVFSSQRKRWIASQFFDFCIVLRAGIYNLFRHGNFDFFDKSLQRVILPRVLLLGLSFFSCIILWVPFTQYGLYFVSLFAMCSFAYLIAIPKSYYNKNTLMAALRLPQVFLLMILALFKSKSGAKKFIHTAHSSTLNSKNS